MHQRPLGCVTVRNFTATIGKPRCRARRAGDCLLRATGVAMSVTILGAGANFACADTYGFVGATVVVPTYGTHPAPGSAYLPGPSDGYTYNTSGSWTTAGNWGDGPYPGISNDSSGHGVLTLSPTMPGAGDTVFITGSPKGAGAPVMGPVETLPDGEVISGYYGRSGGAHGFTGDGFQISNATGNIAVLSVTGVGNLQLAGLTATTSATFSSIGGLPIYTFADANLDLSFNGYAPSVQTISGGSLSTPLLTLSAGTNLNTAFLAGGPPFPSADAGSLTITGATVSGDVTQVVSGSASASSIYNVQPVTLTSNATLNAKTELDIVGSDPALFPLSSGTTTLNVTGSAITAGSVVIATGSTGLGSGSAGVAGILTLMGASSLTATNSIFVGDTGAGTLNASAGSTITDQQAVIGNAAKSTGTATIDGSTWNNSGYLSVGNFGVGTLMVKNGGQINNTGPNGNGFISGLAGSGGSVATITGTSSLWQTSGYFEIGGGDGTGTLNVQKDAQVITADIMYIGENAGATGTLAISGGATVTSNSTGAHGTSSTVLGLVANSTGNLTIDGMGSQLESKVDMSVGYGGIGNATITNGGSLVVDGTHLRVGRNEGSTGALTVTGNQSSVTANNGTIYVGFGGMGTVNVNAGASLTVMGTSIGGQETGVGLMTIDGAGTTADIGDAHIGDSGQGTLNLTGGASVTAGDVAIGTTPDDAGTLTFAGQLTSMTADDVTVGDQANGIAVGSDHASLSAASLTVGSSQEGLGTMTLDSGSSVTTSSDLTIGDDEGSTGTLTVGLNSAAQLTVGGDATVGGSGTGTLLANNGSTVTFNGGRFTIGDQSSGAGQVTLNGATFSFGGDLTIGAGGNGELLMQEGAKSALGGISLLAPSVTIAEQTNSIGTLGLDGNGTSLQVSKLTVGELGNGTLMLSNKALLTCNGEMSVADQLSGAVSSVSVGTASTLAINSDLTVGGGGVATMTVNTGGKATAVGDITLGDNPNASGIVTVDGVTPTAGSTAGSRSSLGYGGTLAVGHFGAGTLNVTGGALVAPTPNGMGEVDIAAMSKSSGGVSVSGSDSKSGKLSELDANLLAIGGTMKTAGGSGNLTVGASGVVKVKDTLQTWTSATLDVSGGGSVTVGSGGSGGSAAAGEVRVDAGGTFGGGGTVIGNLTNAGGKVSPDDPMTLSVNGDFTQTDGVLDLQIAGTGAGEYDKISATGDISITGGTIDLDFINDYAPKTGDTFEFLAAPGGIDITGTTFDVLGLEPGFQFNTTTDPVTGGIEVVAANDGTPVPEPLSSALVVGGLGALGLLARRRRSVS